MLPWVAALGALAGLVATAVPIGGAPIPHPSVNPTQPSQPVVQASLLFDGHSAANATSVGSAIGVNARSLIPVSISWVARGGKLGTPGSVSVQQARVDLLLFGASTLSNVLNEQPAVVGSNGTANLSLDYRQYVYLAEGVYELRGSLLAPNGSALWTELFFIHVTATDHLTLFTLGSAALAVYAVASFATARERKPPDSVEGA